MLEIPGSQYLNKITELRPQYTEYLIHSNDEATDQWLGTLLGNLARHSPWTYEHSLRVGYIAARLAEEFNGNNLDHVLLQLRAATFHDIGKLKTPVSILDTGELEPWQRTILDRHPGDGFETLKDLDYKAAQIMVAHHEFQERSYPRTSSRTVDTRLLRDQKFLALADGVDALRSKRPYKQSWSIEETIEHLKELFQIDDVIAAIQIREELMSFH